MRVFVAGLLISTAPFALSGCMAFQPNPEFQARQTVVQRAPQRAAPVRTAQRQPTRRVVAQAQTGEGRQDSAQSGPGASDPDDTIDPGNDGSDPGSDPGSCSSWDC